MNILTTQFFLQQWNINTDILLLTKGSFKKVTFLVAWPLRERFFEARKKDVTTKLEDEGLKEDIFCGFPKPIVMHIKVFKNPSSYKKKKSKRRQANCLIYTIFIRMSILYL